MRIGINPNKQDNILTSEFFHQVIMPVHIPSNEGYFKESFEILKLSLESLIKTSHNKTFITVVANDCYVDVEEYLLNLYKEKKIQEIIFTNAIGKINAILKGLAGQISELVTIADSDVLFLNKWQKETYKVFESFPKCAAVSPTPSSKVLKQYTTNIIFENFFSNKLKFSEVKNPEAMKKFGLSLGNNSFYNNVHLDKYLTINKGESSAVVGAGHFVVTYKTNVFKRPQIFYSKFKMGDALKKVFDEPVLKQGYYRLSTLDNFTYHLGNNTESWMFEEFDKLNKNDEIITVPKLVSKKTNSVMRLIYQLFFNLLSRKSFWMLFLRWKGLTSQEANQY